MTFQDVPMLSLSRRLLPAIFYPFDCSLIAARDRIPGKSIRHADVPGNRWRRVFEKNRRPCGNARLWTDKISWVICCGSLKNGRKLSRMMA